jgi:hypothetical protein
MFRVTLALAFAAAVLFGVAAPGAQKLSPADVLDRAAAYVENYRRRLETIVAEERYVQRSASAENGTGAAEERTLRSDFMLLPGIADENPWYVFRDVFEVDGRAVSSERGRLEAWLSDSRSSLLQNARALALEQARYNIGPVMRTINVPTLALEILKRASQERFRFRPTGTTTMERTEVTIFTFEERRRPTMIRTPEGRDLPARGTLWIESGTGRVLRTELRTGERKRDRIEATISVAYVYVPRLDLLLPGTMDERYTGPGTEITCRAEYSNFRRFETDARIIRGQSLNFAS